MLSPTLDHLLLPFQGWMADPFISDIFVNGPDSIWTHGRGQWLRQSLTLDPFEIEDIAIVAAAQRRLDIWHGNPFLDIELGDRGRRLNAIAYPAVAEGKPSLSIRQGTEEWPTIRQLAEGGLFRKANKTKPKRIGDDLLALYKEERFDEFFELSVARRLNILFGGVTGSGKTHFLKACIRAIRDVLTRVVSIEDTNELQKLASYFANSVQLFYDASGGAYTADKLVFAAMRMLPKELIFQEIRDGDAALAYLYALQTGHCGKTTVHANDCRSAFDRIRYVIKKCDAGQAMQDADITAQLTALIDVVVHQSSDDGEFHVDEIWLPGLDQCR